MIDALRVILRTLRNEILVAAVTGAVAYGLTRLLTRDAGGAAVAFGLTAAMAAAALDTLFFHLFFLLREARMQAAELHYQRELNETRRRLLDGSTQMREALIRRFEQDYRRSRATHTGSESRRQVREARRRMRGRLWALDWVVSGDQLVQATTEARSDPDALDRWTSVVDGLVDLRAQVQRRQSVFSGWFNVFHPARLARQTLLEAQGFSRAA